MFEDAGRSGSDRARPGLIQLKHALNRPTRSPKLLIVYEVDRVYRDLNGLLMFLESQVKNSNTHVYFVKENMYLNGPASLEDESTYMMLTMIGLMADLERKRIASRTRETMAAKKAAGVMMGRPRNESLDKQIIDLHFEGNTIYATAKKLNVSNGKILRAWEALCLGKFGTDGLTDIED